jgi:hypothetical protein
MSDSKRGQATLPSAAPKRVEGRGVDALNAAVVPRLGRAQLSPIGENTAAQQIIAGAGRQLVSAVHRVGEGVQRRGQVDNVVPANNPVASVTAVVSDPRRPHSPRNQPRTSDTLPDVTTPTDPPRHTRKAARDARRKMLGPFAQLREGAPASKRARVKKKKATKKKKKATKKKKKATKKKVRRSR